MFGEVELRNAISGNTIFSNNGLGIDLGVNGVGTGADGANNDKAAPVITGIALVVPILRYYRRWQQRCMRIFTRSMRPHRQ